MTCWTLTHWTRLTLLAWLALRHSLLLLNTCWTLIAIIVVLAAWTCFTLRTRFASWTSRCIGDRVFGINRRRIRRNTSITCLSVGQFAINLIGNFGRACKQIREPCKKALFAVCIHHGCWEIGRRRQCIWTRSRGLSIRLNHFDRCFLTTANRFFFAVVQTIVFVNGFKAFYLLK